MKKIIYFCGIIFLAIVLTLNVFFTTHMDTDEHIKNKSQSYTPKSDIAEMNNSLDEI